MTSVRYFKKKYSTQIDRHKKRHALVAGYYLVWQCLRGRVADPTPICDTGDFSSHFQNMSQGQIGNVSIVRPARPPSEKAKVRVGYWVFCSSKFHTKSCSMCICGSVCNNNNPVYIQLDLYFALAFWITKNKRWVSDAVFPPGSLHGSS